MSGVELKQITAIVDGDDYKKGEENDGYSSTETIPTEKSKNDLEYGVRHRNGSAEVDVEDETPEKQMADYEFNGCQRGVNSIQEAVLKAYNNNKVWFWRIFKIIIFILYLIYFGFAMKYEYGDEGSIRLLVGTILVCILIAVELSWNFIRPPFDKFGVFMESADHKTRRKIIRWVLYALALIGIIVILVKEVALETPRNLLSLAGLAAYLVICYILSTNPGKVNFHPVFWGLTLQFYFAFIILRTQWGRDTFTWLGDRVKEFLVHTDAGSNFAFGDKISRDAHMFVFSIMPVVTFFSAFISITYYLGAMQAVVRVIGRFLAFCLGTTPAESLNAAGNIFVGMTEAPLMIRPFLKQMTKSELHAVMTGGFATIAGSVFGAYIGYGAPADHLLAASVMSAPAALAISKLMCPETEVTTASADDYYKMKKGDTLNIFEAALEGATMSIRLIANIVVNVVAFLALLAFLNATLQWFGDRVGIENFTFELICSYVLYPVAILMGASPEDCRLLAELVGVKTFGNEFIAYGRLSILLNNRVQFLNYTQTFNNTDYVYDGQHVILTNWNQTLDKGFMTERGGVIATYALCGFSNFGSMGILLGGLSALAPERQKDLAGLVLRAMVSGNIACFLTACIAGLFFAN